jgi:N-acetylmuramoyl-L-alanine amidase
MKPLTVILDAGHGKETPGKRSPKLDNGNRLFEWKFTREICNKIYCLLQSEGIKCIVANRDDVDYKLSERATRINNLYNKEKKHGHLAIMISVHGNAAGSGDWKTAYGWEVFSTKGTTNSDKLAKCFCNVFKNIFPDKRLRGHKEENFTIIYKTNCPCVLTENFFYDNKEECELMLSEEGQMKIAELHVEAIKEYIKSFK